MGVEIIGAVIVVPEKWEPVFRKEARQDKVLGSVRDSIKTGQTLEPDKAQKTERNTVVSERGPVALFIVGALPRTDRSS